MQQKLIDIQQFGLLKTGDILYRFPSGGLPEATFDVSRNKEIMVYRIKSFNKHLDTLKLIMADESLELFTWPEDIEQLSLNKFQIIREAVWWI